MPTRIPCKRIPINEYVDYNDFDPFDEDEPIEIEEEAPAKCRRLKNLLEAFNGIVENAVRSGLDDAFMKRAAPYIRYASRKLHLPAMQTVLLALCIEHSDDRAIRLCDIGRAAGCSHTRMLQFKNDLDELYKAHYLRSGRSSDVVSYRVPPLVVKAISENHAYEYEPIPVYDLTGFFNRFGILMEQHVHVGLNHDEMVDLLQEAYAQIKETHFAKSIDRMDLSQDDFLIFMAIAYPYFRNDDNEVEINEISMIYDCGNMPIRVSRELCRRRNTLFEKGLIDNAVEEGMARKDTFCLTDDAKQDLLSELELEADPKKLNDLIAPETLTAKRMFYNDDENRQIGELTEILGQKRFVEVQKRLKEAGMRTGFCCLFYGAPGTGKTETVNQIARATGRSIMRIDVEKFKSAWVGESEKKLSQLFNRYRKMCKGSGPKPILLFNEADAVLGVRMEGATRAVDKMENSLQNIILQEMESLDGIMIATTNLTTNLDKAFERRFLYKIRYERPTTEARANIWRSMLPKLDESQAMTLASKFNLSGGEIENITRKFAVNAILTGRDDVDMEAITKACQEEHIVSGHTRIGF